jgi:predicted phage tail protein
VYEAVNVTVAVTDPFLVTPSLVVNGTNASMAPGTIIGTWYRRFTPMAVQTYAFTVWAYDRRGNVNSSSGSVAARDTKPPPMPMGLVATLVGGSVQLNWNPVSAFDLDGYRLNRSTSPLGPFTRVGPAIISGTAYTDQTVQPGVTYYYVVLAVDVRGHASMASNVAHASVPVPSADLTFVAIGGVAIAIIVAALAVAVLLRRRRQKGG